MPRSIATLRTDALAIYRAALDGADPAAALTAALGEISPRAPVWIIAVGKAARPTVAAALATLERFPTPLRGGLVISPESTEDDSRLPHVRGDHPLPGSGSRAAASALSAVVAQVAPGDEVWVLLSGGATSLLGAPIEGVSDPDYRAFVETVGAAGLPIAGLNLLRKRFSRWGAGRLAVALAAARVRVFAMSDVPGDDLAAIGSGPCVPDGSSASDVRSLLEQYGLTARLPLTIRRELDQVIAGQRPETPKPDAAAFRRVTSRIIGSNAIALDRAAAHAATLGYRVRRLPEPLVGDAAAAGISLARLLVTTPLDGHPIAWLGGGETTVALGHRPGRGGRCQELALAAARNLTDAGADRSLVLLAGGTDGRDGPTDAAGAIVDPTTWPAIAARGVDPELALRRHDAYPALDAVDGLIRIGLTGTNVMDVIVGLAG